MEDPLYVRSTTGFAEKSLNQGKPLAVGQVKCVGGSFFSTETVTVGKLSEDHAEELVPIGKMSDRPVAAIFLYNAIEYPFWKKARRLCENIFALVHVSPVLDRPT